MFKIFIFYFIHSFFFFFFYLFYFIFLHIMYEKEVTSAWNPSNWKFLREKRKSSLKFKAKNWDFGREEWNNYYCKFVLLYKLELLTNQWRKKILIKKLCYREKEKLGEKREERELEREREREREGTKKLCFAWLQMEIIFIRDAKHERKIVFQKPILKNNL